MKLDGPAAMWRHAAIGRQSLAASVWLTRIGASPRRRGLFILVLSGYLANKWRHPRTSKRFKAIQAGDGVLT
jgi:hypothetical protein